MRSIAFGPDVPAEQIVEEGAIRILLQQEPERYYRHGWQSWSLAAWVDTGREIPIQQPYLLHPMQQDPMYAGSRGNHGSWVGAVELEPGKVLLLGALGLETHVALEGRELYGWCESGPAPWFVAHGDEQTVFERYAQELGRRLGKRVNGSAPRVWCSWYSMYTAVDEAALVTVLDGLRDLPFDVAQVDDGWQLDVGDWQANSKFPSGMHALAERIKATGRGAGLWLAPFVAKASSSLVREHRDWLLHDAEGRLVSAGCNWGAALYGLDTTHPAALDWLQELVHNVRDWGYDYLKLDFLYGAALPARRHEDMPRETAYRRGLQAIREAIGQDAFLVACGSPILPSIGICDALRAGPDVSEEWENERDAVLLHNHSTPGTRNAIRTTAHRLWLRPLTHVDPDVIYFRSRHCRLTAGERQLQHGLALICDFKANSDPPQWLTEDERAELKRFLEARPQVRQSGPRDFSVDEELVDFGPALDIADTPRGWDGVRAKALGWLANHRLALRAENWLRQHEIQRRKRDWQ